MMLLHLQMGLGIFLMYDQDAFYMFTTVTPTQTSAKQLLGCGLYNAAIESGVIPNWFLFAPTYLNNASYTLDHTMISGGWPLFYQLESSKLLTTHTSRSNKNHVLVLQYSLTIGLAGAIL
jgi:hypothetical protein